MVLIYGEPTVGNGYSTHEISWEQCYSMCYWDANCSLSYHYSSQCKLYAYGNYTIKHLNRTDGKLIGMKRNLTTDTCPSNPLAGTDSFNDNCIVYRNNITSNGLYWTITYSTTLDCDSCGTKLFRRDNYLVCVGVKHFPSCGEYKDAIELCKKDGWESITGPYSAEEFEYFISNRPSRYGGYSVNYWVDGEKTTFQDPTHNGTSNYPKCKNFGSANCHYIAQSCDRYGISPCICTYKTVGLQCWRGATCLKKVFNLQ